MISAVTTNWIKLYCFKGSFQTFFYNTCTVPFTWLYIYQYTFFFRFKKAWIRKYKHCPYGPIYIYGRYVSKALNNYDEAIPTEFWILMYIDCSVRSRAFTFETDTSAWNRFIGKEGANINRIRQKLLEVGYRFEKSARIALYVVFVWVNILGILEASSTYSVHKTYRYCFNMVYIFIIFYGISFDASTSLNLFWICHKNEW